MTYDELLDAPTIRAELDVHLECGNVRVVYDAAKISAAWLQRAITMPRKALAEIILDWNVTDRNGQPMVGKDTEEWERLFEPVSIRGVLEPIVVAIVDDWRGGGKA